MTEQNFPIPRVGVGGIIINHEGKVLLGHRIGSHGSGTWALPGGHLEFGETPEQCIVRELLEEADLRIKGFVSGIHIYTNDVFAKENKHYITLYVVSTNFEGDIKTKEPHKCLEWRWCCWDELPEPLFLPLKNLQKSGFNPFKHL